MKGEGSRSGGIKPQPGPKSGRNQEVKMAQKSKPVTHTINILKDADGKWIDDNGQPLDLNLRKKDFLKGKKQSEAKEEMSKYYTYLAKRNMVKAEEVLYTKSAAEKIDEQIEKLMAKKEKLVKGGK